MNRLRLSFRAAVALAGLSRLAACSERTADVAPADPATTSRPDADRDLLARGERLVRLGGCADCHTPMRFDERLNLPMPMRERALSGHPEGAPDPSATPGNGDQAVIGPTFTSFKTHLGTVYSANITPDRDTGLGRWTAEQFIAALHSGRHSGDSSARPILPPMPWAAIGSASDAELRAMFRYLQSIPPIHNQVSEPKVDPESLRALAASYEQLANTEPR